MKKQALIVLVLSPLILTACSGREKAIEKIHDDEETIKKASAVVNEVLRNATDCEAAKPLIPEAYKKIEEADRQVTAPATHSTLAALKVQVDRIAQVCP